MRLGLVTVLLCLPQTGFAQSAVFPSDAACYLRYYNAEHMAKHPNQRVEEIMVGPDQTQWGSDPLVIKISISLVNVSGYYRGVAYCSAAGAGLVCQMEGDAGAFQLTPARDGAVKIDLGPDGISFEGETDFVTLDGSKGDDRSFVMPPVPADSCP